jgi:2-keto-4-pentenoate hydratase/2-oxohepta-3-ene-1,7-dioic acid hydratase in catechol pathway
LLTADAVPDVQNLDVEFRLNGEVMQKANTSDMLFGIVEILVFLSGSSTVPANSVIITGSPAGVGMGRTPPRWLKPGDTMATEISGIGILENPVGEEVLG